LTEQRITCAVTLVMRLSNLLCRVAVAAASFAMIACADPGEPQPDPEAAKEVGQVEPLPHTLPPPSGETPRYVGVWATTAEGCAEPAWRFRADGVSTLGEVSCSFDDVQMMSNGYMIASTCHSEGTTTTHQMQLSFAESARAMMIADSPWQPGTSLVYCGALPTE
jgi:hypothetical protein